MGRDATWRLVDAVLEKARERTREYQGKAEGKAADPAAAEAAAANLERAKSAEAALKASVFGLFWEALRRRGDEAGGEVRAHLAARLGSIARVHDSGAELELGRGFGTAMQAALDAALASGGGAGADEGVLQEAVNPLDEDDVGGGDDSGAGAGAGAGPAPVNAAAGWRLPPAELAPDAVDLARRETLGEVPA